MRPTKIQITQGNPPSWSVFAVHMKKLGTLATQWAPREDSDQTGRMPRPIWVFAGRKGHFVGFVVRRLKYCSNWLSKLELSKHELFYVDLDSLSAFRSFEALPGFLRNKGKRVFILREQRNKRLKLKEPGKKTKDNIWKIGGVWNPDFYFDGTGEKWRN